MHAYAAARKRSIVESIISSSVVLLSFGRTTPGQGGDFAGRSTLFRGTASRAGTAFGRRFGFSGPRQFDAEFSFDFADNLRIGHGFAGFVFGHHLGLFVDGRRQFLLRDFLCCAGLCN